MAILPRPPPKIKEEQYVYRKDYRRREADYLGYRI